MGKSSQQANHWKGFHQVKMIEKFILWNFLSADMFAKLARGEITQILKPKALTIFPITLFIFPVHVCGLFFVGCV